MYQTQNIKQNLFSNLIVHFFEVYTYLLYRPILFISSLKYATKSQNVHEKQLICYVEISATDLK